MNVREQLIKLVGELRNSQQNRDGFLESRLEQLGKILTDYANNPLDMSLVERANEYAEEAEAIPAEELSAVNQQRAQIISAVVFSRIRRTHYSAYLAGSYSTSESVGKKYKSWMNNAAANGALSLHQAIQDVVADMELTQELQILKAFAASAKEDAHMFLSFASKYDPESVLTAYNRAKIDILSRQPALIENACSSLLALPPLHDHSHAADICWHEDNYRSFMKFDTRIREILQVEHGHMMQEVEHALKRNSKAAGRIRQRRSNIWEEERSSSNRALVVGSLVGTATLSLVALSPEVRQILMDLLTLATNIFAQVMENPDTARAAGDGGLPLLAGDGGLPLAREIVAITFGGDGGLPI